MFVVTTHHSLYFGEILLDTFLSVKTNHAESVMLTSLSQNDVDFGYHIILHATSLLSNQFLYDDHEVRTCG